MRRDFSCQKSDIPGTAIGRDHAGERENKIIKSRVGITGITRNENSRTRHILASPILSSMSKEIMEIGGTNISKASLSRHQLSPSYNKRQNENISALVNVLHAYVSSNSETVQLQNIITGQLYSKEIIESFVTVEQLGNNLFDEFIKEMQPESEESIFNAIKTSSVRTFTSSNKPLKLKVHD